MTSQERGRRILIVSSHPLFGAGLSRLLRKRQSPRVQAIDMASNTDEAVTALMTLTPDLVIVDYDDEAVKRKEFLAHFVEGKEAMRVVLVSLKEGGEVVVYDRHTLAPTQMEDWLEAALTSA